mgnify:CR=1 FL=1
MTETFLTIRQMCELFDVTPRTLRFYEAKELLFPRRIGQKRLFTKRDRGRMKLIIRGKRYGFSLEDIRQLLDLYQGGQGQYLQIESTLKIAGDRLSEMEARKKELDAAIGDLRAQITEGREIMAAIETARNSTAAQ